jgi:site-specific recombinase XerC
MNINPSSDVVLPQNNVVEDGMQNDNVNDILNRLETPIVLDPETTSFEEIKQNGLVIQYLSEHTVEKHLRYLRFMENYGLCPVDLRRPDRENFLKHIRTRLYLEDPPATPNAIRHEWKAMRMLLRAYGLQCWDVKLPPMTKCCKRVLPLPEVVREFWHYDYTHHKVFDKTLQYMFFVGFNLGIRCPSELAVLKTKDFVFNRDGSAIVTVTEAKKRNQRRSIVLPYEIASDPKHKSFGNWLGCWRPRIASDLSRDYLFVQPGSGKPYTTAHLGHVLSSYGKMVWEYFTPYVMRHWCAVAHLIEQKIDSGDFDVYPVMNWLGHENIQTTMSYVRFAEQYYNVAGYSWLKRVLKYHDVVGVSTLSSTEHGKTLVSDGTPPVGEYGLGEAYVCFIGDGGFDKNQFLVFVGFQPVPFFFFSLDSNVLVSPSYFQQGVGDDGFGDGYVFHFLPFHILSPKFCLSSLRFCWNGFGGVAC